MPPGGIRTHDLSRRAAEDLRLRPRSHWDRLLLHVSASIYHIQEEQYARILKTKCHAICGFCFLQQLLRKYRYDKRHNCVDLNP